MRLTLSLAALLIAAAAPPSQSGWAEQRAEWTRPQAPFRIVGNVYYVGTQGLSAFLVTGPSGHALIDGGLSESAPRIAANIRALGFRLRDVRLILINHAHFDHAGGLAALKRASGARLVASAGDAPDLAAGRTRYRPELPGFPAVRVDRVIRDGETLRLGPIALTAHVTPGHTKGATSWTTVTGGRTVLFATSLTVAGQNLVDDPGYPAAAADFRRSFATLSGLRADVFVNFHPEMFEMKAKRAAQQTGKADAFVDPGEVPRQLDRAERAFTAELVAQRARAGRAQ